MMKLSGLAPPSCCCGSSQRAAMLVCHASTSLPLGMTFPAARVSRTNGVASAVVASAAVRNTVRRVTVVLSTLYSTATTDRINPLAFELYVFPGISVAGALEGREHILPLRSLYSRPDPVHEGVAEHRDEVVVLKDFALELFRQCLARSRFIRCQILVVFGVEFWDAEFVGGEHAAAFEFGLIPIRPSGTDAGAGEQD